MSDAFKFCDPYSFEAAEWRTQQRQGGTMTDDEFAAHLQLIAERDALEADNAALRKDAERWRWITKNYGLEADGFRSWKLYTLVPVRPRTQDKAELDSAIDAAMCEGKETK